MQEFDFQDSAFKRARRSARRLLTNPRELHALLRHIETLIQSRQWTLRPKLSAFKDRITVCVAMLKAWSTGEYRQIPWHSLVALSCALVYFVHPVDAIPDFIISVGYLDDMAFLAWVTQQIQHDIEQFQDWRKQQDS